MAVISLLDFFVTLAILRIVKCFLMYSSKIFVLYLRRSPYFCFLENYGFMPFMQKITSYLPPKRMFSMFSNFLVFFVYPVLNTPHTVFRFLSFSLLVKIRQMSHKTLIGHFCIKTSSYCR